MQQERFYTAVGLFVAGALVLLIAGGLYVYDRYLHAQVETYVMFFKGSLNGLDTTSIVTYRGVKIGRVRSIEITENKTRTNVQLPVYVEFFVEKSFGRYANPVRLMINNGMVANITSPNLLTGIANIELVKSPTPETNQAISYRGFPVFPTKRNVIKVSSIEETLKSAQKALNRIAKLVRSKEVQQTIVAARDMANSLNTLATTLDNRLPSAIMYFNDGFKQFSKTAYTTQNFVDYLSRHPEALLRGKR